jgi:hypothetical protein
MRSTRYAVITNPGAQLRSISISMYAVLISLIVASTTCYCQPEQITDAPIKFLGIRWGAPQDSVRIVMENRVGVRLIDSSDEHLSFSGGVFDSASVLQWDYKFVDSSLYSVKIQLVRQPSTEDTEWLIFGLRARISDKYELLPVPNPFLLNLDAPPSSRRRRRPSSSSPEQPGSLWRVDKTDITVWLDERGRIFIAYVNHDILDKSGRDYWSRHNRDL